MQNSGMSTLGHSGNRPFSTGIFGTNASQGLNSIGPTPLSWQESKMARPIRPKEAIDPLTKKDLTAWTKKDGPYTLKCIAGLEEYRNMDLSIIEIRIFTYMQAMGCFQQAIENGFAAETVKKMKGNQTGQNNTSGQSGNIGGTTFGGIFQSKFNRDGIFNSNRSALNQGQGQGNNQNILGQSPNTTNFLSQPTQNTQNIFATGPPQNLSTPTQNQPFFQSQPTTQQQQLIFNAPQLPVQFPQQIRYPPLPAQLSNYLNESILNQLSDHLLKHYTSQIVSSLLARAGITNHILDFLFYMGFNPEQIKEWIIRRILMKQLEDERYRQIEGLLKGQERGEWSQSNGEFGKYVDFLLARQKYTWQEEVLREGMRKMVRESPFSGDKGDILRQMLEIEDKSNQNIREKYPFNFLQGAREERREKTREKQQSVWLDDETVDRFQLDKVPIVHRRVPRP